VESEGFELQLKKLRLYKQWETTGDLPEGKLILPRRHSQRLICYVGEGD